VIFHRENRVRLVNNLYILGMYQASHFRADEG